MVSLLRTLAMTRPGLALSSTYKRWQRRRLLRTHSSRPGRCPVCASETQFVTTSSNPREGCVCVQCGSVPRQRAVAQVLLDLGRDLGACAIHESSPSLCSWRFLSRMAGRAVGSYFFDGTKRSRVGVFHAVDLQAQPFADGTFDVVVTQDVFEHVPEPMRAFAEIHRTLRPDGLHVFTVPRRPGEDTHARARVVDGRIELQAPAEYHVNPIDQCGSLVVTDWGRDLEATLLRELGVQCRLTVVHAPELGIDTPIEVFVAGRASTSVLP